MLFEQPVQPVQPSPTEHPAIAWPYDVIYSEWDKITDGLKNRTRGSLRHPSHEDMEDGILNSFELLEKKKPCFKNTAQAYLWLYRALGNYLHHSRRAAGHIKPLDAASGFATEDVSIRAFETQNEIDHVIGPLSDEYQELLYLNHVSGITLKEIAEMRSVSLDSVQSRHARALKQFKKKFVSSLL